MHHHLIIKVATQQQVHTTLVEAAALQFLSSPALVPPLHVCNAPVEDGEQWSFLSFFLHGVLGETESVCDAPIEDGEQLFHFSVWCNGGTHTKNDYISPA